MSETTKSRSQAVEAALKPLLNLSLLEFEAVIEIAQKAFRQKALQSKPDNIHIENALLRLSQECKERSWN